MSALLAVLAACALSISALTVWPQPQSQTWPDETITYTLDPYHFNFTATGEKSEVLDDAFRRYFAIVFQHSASRRRAYQLPDILGADVMVLTGNLSLTIDTDESYTLAVIAPRIQIQAQTAYGALRAIETLSQLVYRGSYINSTTVVDYPRFPVRAILIDTSRHWYPLQVIIEHLDAMAYNKFNVLHWHIVDTVSFPFQSWTFPSLSQTGAYTPDHIYTHEDIKYVVEYAMLRGIRVIPEFDTPGHVGAGYASIPNLLTECNEQVLADYGTALNPTLNSTYEFLTSLYAEIKNVFPDEFVHVGGDEVAFNCWQNNSQITTWMAENNISSYSDLESYYEVNLLHILEAQGTSYICWQELFQNGVALLPNTVIDVWKGGWEETMSAVTNASFRSILSAPFYLNYISYGEDWINYYTVEPTNFTSPQILKDTLVSGIEACMWSEYVDATNFISRMWPRASAVGERAWSSINVTDVNDAQARLFEWSCKMIQRNIASEPAADGGADNGQQSFCDFEYDIKYQAPWQ